MKQKNDSIEQINTRLDLKKQNIIQINLIILIIGVVNVLSLHLYKRFDLTQEKRFTITETSQKIISELEGKVYIEIYLTGENLRVDLVRYQKMLKEFMDNFSSYSDKVDYIFKNPFDEKDPAFNSDVFRQLMNKGLNPTYTSETIDGGVSQKMVFAGALVKYHEKEYPVNFINNNLSNENTIVGLSEAELERDFTHAIWMLSRKNVQKIAFLEGNGELDENQVYDIMHSLSKYYQIDRLKMNNSLSALNEYSVVVVAKPTKTFTERDKFIIDQYIMKGGSVIWLVEWMSIDMDSLSHKSSEMAMINNIKLEDQLFRYGVRINPDLIQDIQCLKIPVFVNVIDGKPQFQPKNWYFFPLITTDTLSNHQLLRNLEPIRTHFVSSIDTVGNNPDVKKTILLRTSQYSKATMHPVEVNLEILKTRPDINTFNKPNIPIAVLMEGTFTSNFKNRFTIELYEHEDFHFIENSKPNTKMIVISDGDFIRNEVRTLGTKIQSYSLGEDKYYPNQQSYQGNKQFFMNCVNYLCADDNFISLRMREIKTRTINSTLLKQKRIFWTYMNSIVPILLILLLGLTVIFARKLKYKKRFLKYKLPNISTNSSKTND
ncbi:gliding motility-associated ABC transporter substrate-binding protein GldG [Bacteroidales bacterium OttesenSCG-928-I21]|nr:gliding motility-associated ABC transporter substrate-binding protein GldG [Bacteroidales bacterium OttesenSCG-928-I21]